MNLHDYLKNTGLSQAALAEMIKSDDGKPVTQGAISQWLRNGVPAARVPQLVRLSGGQMTPESLRPDLWRSEDGAAA